MTQPNIISNSIPDFTRVSVRSNQGEVLFQSNGLVLATVVKNPDSAHSQSLGIKVSGKFIPVALPANVKAGDDVQVKLEQRGNEVLGTYVGLAVRDLILSSASKVSTENPLLVLLRQVNLEAEARKTLTSTLLESKSVPLLKVQDLLPELDVEASLKQLPILNFSSKNLSEPSKLGELIKQIKQQVIGDKLGEPLHRNLPDRNLKLEANIHGSKNSNALAPIVKLVSNYLTKIINNSELSAATSIPVQTAKIKEQNSVITVQNRQQELSAGVVRLLKSLGIDERSVQIKGANSQELAQLKAIVNHQLSQVELSTNRVSSLFKNAQESEPVRVVRDVLKLFAPKAEDAQSPQQKILIEFTDRLIQVLDRILENDLPNAEVKLILLQHLKELYQKFALDLLDHAASPTQSLENDNNFSELLPTKQKNFVKLIEAQLRILIESPSGLIEEGRDSLLSTNPVLAKKFVSELEQTLRELAQHLDFAKQDDALSKDLKVFVANAQRMFNSVSESDAEPTNFAKDLRDLYLNLRQNIIEKHGVFAESVEAKEGGGQYEKQRDTFAQRTIKTVALLLEDIIGNQDFGIERALINQAEVGKNLSGDTIYLKPNDAVLLRKALLELIKEIPEFSSPVESEIQETVQNILSKLESDPNKVAIAKNDLKQLQVQMTKHYLNDATDALHSEAIHGYFEPEAMQALSNMVVAQQMLQQINPLLIAQREPTLLIFPFLFRGMLSRLLIESYPDSQKNSFSTNADTELESETAQQEAAQEDPKPKQGYHHYNLKFNLSGLGDIVAEVKANGDEAWVVINASDSHAKENLRAQYDRIAALIRLSGYQLVNLNFK